MVDPELKEYLAITVTKELNRLVSLVENQASTIRTIEINSTKQITEILGEIENIWGAIKSIREDYKDRSFSIEKEEGRRQAADIAVENKVKSVEESQKFNWKTLTEQRNKEREELSQRWEKQAEINQSIQTINRLLWTIIGIMLTIGISYVWNLIVRTP
jgi:chromosome segregation ATPase